MSSPFLGEFLGTMILILLGDGVVAGVVLNKSKAQSSGWMVITTGWALGVMCGAFVALACGSSDAHLNPALTLGFAVRDGSFGKVGPYFGAQLLGAFTGAVLVWLHYVQHWKETPDAWHKLACFCTVPAIRGWMANLFSEIVGTFVLVLVIGAIFSKKVAGAGLASGLGPYLVGSLVWGIGLSLGGTTGYAINPARDLGPRVAHAVLPIAGKSTSDWSYAPIPVIGPLLGGALAGFLLRVLAVS